MSDSTNLDALETGLGHHLAGRLQEAREIYQQILARDANDPDALHLLGALAHQAGRSADAVGLITRAIAIEPTIADYHNNLGEALAALGKLQDAVNSFHRSIELDPQRVDSRYNLARAAGQLGWTDEAVYSYQQALRLHPELVEARYNLGLVLLGLTRLTEAQTEFREAIRLRQDYAEAYFGLAKVVQVLSGLADAVPLYRKALELKPALIGAHSSLVYEMHYHPGFTREAIFEEHLRWAKQHAEEFTAAVRPHANDRTPNRRLKIGFVSADLRRHPVSSFLLPVLEAHDKERYEMICYADVRSTDEMSERLHRNADGWRNIVGGSDEQVAELIRQDGIDILIDLGGHTGHNRLLVFARKPAPIAAAHFAYPNTTGLSTVDYRFTDAHADPPGETERYYTEQLIRLPDCAWCYRAEEQTPIGPLPAESKGRITFGSLNNINKVTPEVIAAWSRILAAVPGSQLLLLTCPPGELEQMIRSRFAAHGIERQRLRIVDRTGREQYLKHLAEMDIALDPFPYNGGVTTCDALWAGLPVISLEGDAYVSRQGVSLLSNVGLQELLARKPDDYVSIAAGLARDLPRLAMLRQGLRERLRASPIMDHRRFTQNLQDAYRRIWQQWCARIG